ncbi:MAG: PSD1 domain-containing protein [Planctomycetaceae bacterium]|nr:PSD1 domain-containing protein [Planctomycetaceae bacterium]
MSIASLPTTRRSSRQTLTFMAGLIFVCNVTLRSAPGDEIDFSRDIRPILSNHCFQCHGPDDETREAELRLDDRQSATADHDGRQAIAPGNASQSQVVARIISKDPDLVMPPPETGKPLTADQISRLTRWIEGGAEYSQHWSFVPIQSPALPSVPADAVTRNGIDHFIIAELDRHGIRPSPEADRFTLIRRACLDLLGLPPTVEEVDQFVADTSEDAYERLIDRLLASPHFGERWGRHWLDQARYADSHGYTNDNERSIWPWRDWVIKAFNDDLPFDRFTIEQLAGDMLPDATLSQRVATGFHRNTLINTEGGTKADQFRDEQVKDRVDTTGLVWMGLTIGCAKCHHHKFDPISQTEYYQLYAFFNSTADNNSETPILKVPSDTQSKQIEELTTEIKSLNETIVGDTERADRQLRWEAALAEQATESATQKDPDAGWTVLELSGNSTDSSVLTSLEDRSLLVKGRTGAPDEYHATAFSPLTKVRSVRLEVLTHESLPQNGPGRAGNGNFVLSEFWFRTGDGRELRFNYAAAEHSQPGYGVAKAIDGNNDTGWAINGAPEGSLNRKRTAWFVLPAPLEIEPNHALTFKMQFHQKDYALGRFRISISEDEWQDQPDLSVLAPLVAIPQADRTDEQKDKLESAFLQQDEKLRTVHARLLTVTKQLESVKQTVPTTMVLQELESRRPTFVQIRGEFLRTSDEVSGNVPAVLPPLAPSEQPHTRLDFAKWLTRPDHPLTARVRVNRIWMQLFGNGLVETENDFGLQGTLPSHPELLDWLASEFQRNGWSQKQLIKLIMMSAVYRQQSANRPDLQNIDRRNLLLARQNRLRVEAEIVRDLALSVSGRLSPQIGGPGVYPPQEDGVYAFTQRAKSWKTSTGDDRYRRGMYTYFYRSAPYPMLETFDVPKFNATCTRRDRSNTPLQSLSMSNSEAMFELATAFGTQLSDPAGPVTDDDQRLVLAFRRCVARPPREEEKRTLKEYLQQCRARFNDEQKAWVAVARLLLNLDEFITRE